MPYPDSGTASFDFHRFVMFRPLNKLHWLYCLPLFFLIIGVPLLIGINDGNDSVRLQMHSVQNPPSQPNPDAPILTRSLRLPNAQVSPPKIPRKPGIRIEREIATQKAAGTFSEKEGWFYQERAFPFDTIPQGARERAMKYARDNMRTGTANVGLQQPQVTGGSWVPFGPSPNAPSQRVGRVNALAVNRSNPNVIYVGGAIGGVWKTIDGGSNWSPRTDFQNTLATGVITLDPVDPNVIYIGTGDKDQGYLGLLGAGILKSTDAGNSFTQLAANTFQGLDITGLLVDPTNTQVLYAGAKGSTPSQCGVFKSTDSGMSWIRLNGAPSSFVSEIRMLSTNSQTIYAAYNSFGNSSLPSGIYRTTNGGSTWTKLTTGSFPTTGVGRISFAIAPSSPNIMYAALEGTQTGDLLNIYKSPDGGVSWSPVTRPIPGNGISQICFSCGYTNVINVSPSDPNTVWFGGQGLYRSTDGGTSWIDIYWRDLLKCALGMQGDLHAIEFDPTNSNRVIVGSDGGIYQSTNGGENWIPINGNLSITQFYSIALHPSDANYVFGGAQDIGDTIRTTNNVWTVSHGGDGGIVLIDPSNLSTLYHNDSFFIEFERSDDGGITWKTKEIGLNKNDQFVYNPPVAMDPSNPQTIYFGTQRLYRSTNRGDSWTVINNNPSNQGFTISTIAIAPNLVSTIYVGIDNTIYVSKDGGLTFENVGSGIPNRVVKRIVVDAGNSLMAYAAVSGFGSGHVFKTSNGGNTWTNISGNLPDIPTNALVLDTSASNKLYAGTDIGVFVTDDGGITWTEVGPDSLPNSPVLDLKINNTTNSLFAATYGRGVFRFGPACTYSTGSGSQNFSASGGEGTVIVNTQNGCVPQPATSNNSWIYAVPSDTNITRYTVTANYDSQPRTGTIAVAGQTFTVQQAGAITACAAPPTGLVAWWRGEGNGLDQTGTNNGNVQAGMSYAAGKVGGGFLGIPASSFRTNRVLVADSPSLALDKSISVEGWLRYDSMGFPIILDRGDDRAGSGPYGISLNSGQLGFTIRAAPNGDSRFIGSQVLPISQFNHFAATLDDTTGQMKLYVNGSQVSQVVTSIRPYHDLDPSMHPGIAIGNFASSTQQASSFSGVIDELSIYNRALSGSEIQAIYNAGTAATGAASKCLLAQSPATVDGRVFTSDGRGLRNATVSLTDSRGVVRTATTSSFGFFSFDNVSTGESYTVRISSRLYRFAPQTVQVNGNLTLPDFVGLE